MTQSKENPSEISQGITKIAVSGYKSIAEECAIEISPLTILAGVNSSGKSSIIQPLLLLKQTLEAPYDPGALLLYGANVKLTSLDQVFSKIDSQKYDNFSIAIEANQSDLVKLTFNKEKEDIEIKQMIYKDDEGIERRLSFNMLPSEIRENASTKLKQAFSDIENDGLSQFVSFQLTRFRCFLEIQPLVKIQYPPLSEKESSRLNVYLFALRSLFGLRSIETIKTYFVNIIHVPGIRGNPERSYHVAGVGKQFSGTFENYVASVISDWQKKRSPKLKKLAEYLSILGLTNKVKTKKLNSTQVEIQVSRLPCNSHSNSSKTDMVSIADVGFGVSQTLPAIVALLVAEPHQLVYLEQPEIHLHPRAQAAFADILVESANRGVKVVVETHSDLILKRVQTLVAEDKIEPDKIKLHWFNRDQNGCTKVTTAELDTAGTFGDWPEDFSEVDLEEESRYLDASELKLMRDGYEEE